MKRFGLAFVLIVSAMAGISGQAPRWDWVKAIHTGNPETATALATDPNSGDVYLAGEWSGELVDFLPIGGTVTTEFAATFGGMDGLVIKMDPGGGLLWAFKVGGESDDQIRDILVDNEGFLYICGTIGTGISLFQGTGGANADFEFLNPGPGKAFLAKYDPLGNPVWVRFAGGIESSEGYGIAINDEAVFMTGSHQGTVSFGVLPPVYSKGGNDMFTVRYSLDGLEQWHVSAGSDKDDRGEVAACDGTHLYIGGNFSGSALEYMDMSGKLVPVSINTSDGQADGFVACFTIDGQLHWSRVIASAAGDHIRGVALDNSQVFLAGTIGAEAVFPLFGADPVPHTGGTDAFVCALTRDEGATNWVQILGGDAGGEQVVHDLAQLGSGVLYATGYYTTSISTADIKNDSKGLEDIFLAAISRTGKTQWIKTAGSAGRDAGNAVCLNASGSLFVAGSYSESAEFDSELLPADGAENLFIAKMVPDCLDAIGGYLSTSTTQVTEGELVTLVLRGYSGVIRWEFSPPDENNWRTLPADPVDSIQIFPTATADYRAYLSSGECAPDSSNVVRVYVGNTSTRFAYAGEDVSICPGDSTLLKASGGGIFKWEPAEWLSMPDVPDPWAKPPVTTTFIVRVIRDDGLTDSDTVTVFVHPRPRVEAGPDLEACQGHQVQLSAEGEGTFIWLPGDLFNDPAVKDPVVVLNQSTLLRVVLTDENQCRASDSVYIHVKGPPVADGGPDQMITARFETWLEARLENWEWGIWNVETGSGVFEDPEKPDTKVTGLELGENQFIWTVSNGFCPESRDLVKIIVRDFLIPTVITPNGDGKNDYFHISGVEEFPDSELVVVNRWGEEVYSASPYLNAWNGVDQKGNELLEDTYYVVLKFDQSRTWKGYLVIMR